MRTTFSKVAGLAAMLSDDERVERQLSRELGVVMAVDAVPVDELPLLVRLRCSALFGTQPLAAGHGRRDGR